MFKQTFVAAIISMASATAALAVPVGGTVKMEVYQRIGANSAQSEADPVNFGGATHLGTVLYTGLLDFGTYDGSNATTIYDWLGTGVGGSYVSNLGASGNNILSAPNINNGTATTTFFDIVGYSVTGFNFTVSHDDGFSFYDDGNLLASSAEPTVEIDTDVNGYNGGIARFVYAATNGNPSVFRVDADVNFEPTLTPVPLPAGLPLLLAGLGAFGIIRRRRAKA